MTKHSMPRQFETERLSCRAWTPDDALALNEIITRNQSWFSPWFPWAMREPTEAETRADLQQSLEAFDRGTEAAYGIRDSGSETLIGMCALHSGDGNEFEVGYWIDEGHSNQGKISEAVRRLIELARENTTAERLKVLTDVNNELSIRVARRLGFTHSGDIASDGPDKAPSLTGTSGVWALALRD